MGISVLLPMLIRHRKTVAGSIPGTCLSTDRKASSVRDLVVVKRMAGNEMIGVSVSRYDLVVSRILREGGSLVLGTHAGLPTSEAGRFVLARGVSVTTTEL